MLINDVLHSVDYSRFEPIKENCHQFFEEAGNFPMVKLLPRNYHDFQKVKIRKRKLINNFTNSFDEAFEHEMHQLRERSLFANGEIFLEAMTDDISVEPFYVFPIDGFDFIYNKGITNSSENYSETFNQIFNQLGESSAEKVFAELIQFSYTSSNLHEGLASGAEIITYGIPYYYTIRKSVIIDYKNLLTAF